MPGLTCCENEYFSAADVFRIDQGKWARTTFQPSFTRGRPRLIPTIPGDSAWPALGVVRTSTSAQDGNCVRRLDCSTKGILMWSPRRLLGIGVIAAGLAVGPAAGLLPHASASPTVNTFQIPLFVANSIWACGFQIFCVSNPVAITGETPGTVTFPAMSPESKGTYWMHWRNLVSGASGVLAIPYSDAVSVFTGPGLVTASMTTGYESIAGTGVFLVP